MTTAPSPARAAATLRAIIARHTELLAAIDAGRAVDPEALQLVAEHAECLDIAVADDDADDICWRCDGSGEGATERHACRACRGSGCEQVSA